MIDLSYLTEEEQEMILAVLKRDAELKKLEEKRIRQLCKSEKDRRRLKYLTGEWFYETKYHRHREKIHSSDIIRASMRQRKPVTILELSQRWAERPSFVNSQKKDVFIPPELSGLIEEPSTQSQNESLEHQMPEGQQSHQIKSRMNPFNIMRSQRDKDRIINGVKEAGQTPAEAVCHELYARPQTSQVSNFHSSGEVKGKANTLCTESQTHTVTEEEGHSISKVLEWFGRGSRDAKQSKLKELPAQSEKNKEEPDDHGTSDIKSEELASPIIQPKTKPSPKTRLGFFALFSRAEKKDKSPVFQAFDKEIISEDKSKIVNLECETPFTMRPEADVSISLQDCVSTVSKTTEIKQVTSKTEVMQDGNATTRPVWEDLLKKEMFDQGEISPGRLANLKSFWEMGNRGPKILSIKTGAEIHKSETYLLNDNDETLDRRIPDPGISPSKLNATEYPVEVESTMHEYSLVSRYGVDMSAISLNENGKPSNLDSSKMSEGSSSELQTHMVMSDVRQVSPSSPPRDNALQNELQEEPLSESLSRDISGLKKEISTHKMSLSQQDNKGSIDDLKSFWEKEKSGLRLIVGSQTCTPDIKDSFTPLSPKCSSIGPTSPDLTSSLDKMSLSLNKEVDSILQNEKMEKSEGPARVPIQDHQDIRGRVPYITQNTSNFKPHSISDKHLKPSSPSSSLRSLPQNAQCDTQQSTNVYQPKDQGQTRTPSPLRQPKVHPKDSYPNKNSRKDGSPLRTFVIDISPADRGQYTDKVKTHEEMPSYSLNNVTEKMSNINCPEGYHMPTSQDISDRHIITLKDGSPFYSKTGHSQVSASEFKYTSTERHGKTLDEDTDIRPIMPKERKLTVDSNSHLARSYIPLSLHHYLGVPEQAVLDERERLGQVVVQTGEAFERMNQGRVSIESSPSRRSQSESEEITFDSSGSSTPETWSFSRTSSACDSEEASPVRSALEHVSARPLSVSKSLEDLASTPSQERWKTDPRTDVEMSFEDVSAVTANTKTYFLDPTQVKRMSLSAPAFMHQQVTGSVMSIYSSDFGNVEVKGTIQFAIHYLQKLGEFHIFVVQCKDLAVADPKRNRSDPYVKCYLLPDKAKYGKRKTCVRKKTLDPTYNEILRFKIPMETLKTQKLNLSVWHNDTFGHNSFLGEVEIDLVEWDFNNTQMNEYLLKGRVQVPSSPKHSADGEEIRAEIRVALRFFLQSSHSHKNKANGEVQIWVKECKNLPISRGVAIDPFVKCAVLPDNSRKSRQKTRVLKRVSNPVFNHTMVYDGFRPEDLKEACVELTVWDHDRLNNHFIGGIRLGLGTGKSYGADVEWMDSNSAEAALWDRMMQSQNEWVEDILPLRMLVMARMSR